MDPDKVAKREPSGVELPMDKKTVGFAARDLSSAKGLESFIKTVAHLQQRGEDIHYVVIGDPASTTYGFEQVFLDKWYGKGSGVHFIDYLIRKYNIDITQVTRTGKLPYAKFSDLLNDIDVFLYPVKYGSGNWGLVELLMRGRPVIAANRCYVPELIEHEVNGVLVSDDRPEVWADAVLKLLADKDLRDRLGANAATAAQAFELTQAAKKYMALFEEVIAEHRAEDGNTATKYGNIATKYGNTATKYTNIDAHCFGIGHKYTNIQTYHVGTNIGA